VSLRGLLGELRAVRVAARGRDGVRWSGEGDVVARIDPDGSVLISESGSWCGRAGGHARFTNAYRWCFDRAGLRLSHERRGEEEAVELSVLVRIAPGRWAATAPHVCGEDVYSALVRETDNGLVLRWRVTGPAKTQFIRSTYHR
jgi:hypothetical protein